MNNTIPTVAYTCSVYFGQHAHNQTFDYFSLFDFAEGQRSLELV